VVRQTPSEGETRADYTLRVRQQHSLPVLAAFKTSLDDLAPKVLPQSFTGKISYAQNQWYYLIRYTKFRLHDCEAPKRHARSSRGGFRCHCVLRQDTSLLRQCRGTLTSREEPCCGD
jgi:Transposase IS66 family